MKNEIANCKFLGWNTGKYDANGCEILSQEQPKQKVYKITEIDIRKKNADFLIISLGSKPTISWRNGSNERLNSRKALENLQKKFTWATDF